MSGAARSKSFVRNGGRQRLIGAVHAAAARSGVDEEARRDLMERLTGKRSAKDLSIGELNAVIDHLNGKREGRGAPATSSVAAKIKALWITLAQLGVIEDGSDAALDKFVARQTRISALRFLTPYQSSSVIEALKAIMTRELGVVFIRYSAKGEQAIDDREMIARAIFARLPQKITAGRCDDYCRSLLGIAERRALSDEDWGDVIPFLAAQFREKRAAAGENE